MEKGEGSALGEDSAHFSACRETHVVELSHQDFLSVGRMYLQLFDQHGVAPFQGPQDKFQQDLFHKMSLMGLLVGYRDEEGTCSYAVRHALGPRSALVTGIFEEIQNKFKDLQEDTTLRIHVPQHHEKKVYTEDLCCGESLELWAQFLSSESPRGNALPKETQDPQEKWPRHSLHVSRQERLSSYHVKTWETWRFSVAHRAAFGIARN